MLKIKRNDIVMVVAGKDKGKTGKVLAVYRGRNRAMVEGINLAKKHVRRTQEMQTGGIVKIERPISLSNIMSFCKNCNRPVRLGFKLLEDNVTKVRFCKKCKANI